MVCACSDCLVAVEMHINVCSTHKLSCYNNYHRLGGLNNEYLFLMILWARSLGSEYQHGQVLGEGPLPVYVSTWAFLAVCMQREISSIFLFRKALIPSWELYPHVLI